MRIKTLRIKVENDNQDFAFSDFFGGSNTIYTTNSQLIKEGEDYYWHVFFTYKTEGTYIPKFPKVEKKVLPAGFEEEYLDCIMEHFPRGAGISHTMKMFMEDIYHFKSIDSFGLLRQFGQKKIENNLPFLEQLLKITRKYNGAKEE